MQSYEKYKKYKLKYLKMKKDILQYGGDKPVLRYIDRINRFRNGTDMEICLNPIYGLYMCENGFIENNYHLYKMMTSIYLDKSIILNRLPKATKIYGVLQNILGVIGPNKIIRNSENVL